MSRSFLVIAILSGFLAASADAVLMAQTTKRYVMPDGSIEEEVIFRQNRTDFSRYNREFADAVQRHWRPPNLSYPCTVGLSFVVDKSGNAYNVQVRQSSGNQMMDASALEALSSTVLPKLPAEANDLVDVDFNLDYTPGLSNPQVASLDNYRQQAQKEVTSGHVRQALECLGRGLKVDPTYAPLLNDLTKILANYIVENVDPRQVLQSFLQGISANKTNENALDKINTMLKSPSATPEPPKTDPALAAMPGAPASASLTPPLSTVAAVAPMSTAPQADHSPPAGSPQAQMNVSPATKQQLAHLSAQRSQMDKVWRLKEAVEKNPTPENHVLFGQALEYTSAFDAAQEQYKAALAKDPTNSSARVLLQGLMQRKRKKDVENAIAMGSQYGVMSKEELNNAAVQAIAQGQYANAIGFLEEAMKKDPAYPVARQNLALAYNNYGLSLANDPARALKMFRKALYFKPNDSLVSNNVKAIMAKLGKDPANFETHMELGDECTLEQDYIGASVEFQEALKLREDPLARAKLTDAQKKVR